MKLKPIATQLFAAALAASALLLGATNGQAQATASGPGVVSLTAAPATATLPDGNSVPMWGLTCTAASGGASCAALNSSVQAANAAILAATTSGATPPAGLSGQWSPVIITIPSGQDLNITLTNALSFSTGSGANNDIPTSLQIVGQFGGGIGSNPTYAASPVHPQQGVTWPVANGSGSTAPIPGTQGATFSPPPQGARVQSFGTEVQANTTTTLCWGVCGKNLPPLKPGTYLIESGTHPSIQVPMGLHGILVVTAEPTSSLSGTTSTELTPGTAYPTASLPKTTQPFYPGGVSYDGEVALELGEIDPVQNNAVQTAVTTAGFSETAPQVLGAAITGATLTSGGAGYTIAGPNGTTLTTGILPITFSPSSACKLLPSGTATITGGVVTGISLTPITSTAGTAYGTGCVETVTASVPGGSTTAGITLTTSSTAMGIQCGLPGGSSTSPAAACYPPAVNYTPQYYLVNGQAFDKTHPASSLFPTYPNFVTGSNLLVRVVNAGSRMHVPAIVGATTSTLYSAQGALQKAVSVPGMTLVAEDGNPVPGVPRIQSDVFMAAGKTYDFLINPTPACSATSGGSCTTNALAFFDRELSLSGGEINRDAGMIAYIGTNGASVPASAALKAAVANADTYNVLLASPNSAGVTQNNTVTLADPSKGVIANDVNVFGVTLMTQAASGTVQLNRNGTFTYTPAAGSTATTDSFTYCANGTVTGFGTANVACSSKVTATVSLAADSIASTGVTCSAQTFNASTSGYYTINPPGVLAGCKDAANLPIYVQGASGSSTALIALAGPGTGQAIVDANGGFQATVSAPGTYTFSINAVNSLGLGSPTPGTITVTFPKGSNLSVSVLDGADKQTLIQDYRWIIEEDMTFFVDHNCTTNPLPAGCDALPASANNGQAQFNYGTSFHTSAMRVVAQGCTGALSCGSGQSVQGVPAVCDVGNGVCRTSASQYTPSLPGSVALDPTKRYYLSVLPGDAANPFNAGYAGTPQCASALANGQTVSVSTGTCGHGMGGAPIAKGQTSVIVLTQPSPYPTAHVTAYVYEDDYPLNGEIDTGGAVDVIAAQEPGLGGFQILLQDVAGGTGDMTGTPTYDMFNQPLSNAMAGTIDPVTLLDACPVSQTASTSSQAAAALSLNTALTVGATTFTVNASSIPASLVAGAGLNDNSGFIPAGTTVVAVTMNAANTAYTVTMSAASLGNSPTDVVSATGAQSGITGMVVTCPKYEADGKTLSPLAGMAMINNMYPGRYSVQAIPGADRIARGEEWLQTNTLDGQKAHDAFLRIGEPAYFQEYGPSGFHVNIGYANPAIINNRRHNAGNSGWCDSPNLSSKTNGNGTLVGQLDCSNSVVGYNTTVRMSRVPDERLYGSGNRNGFAFTQCFAALSDPDGATFAFTKCDPVTGAFSFGPSTPGGNDGVPAGNWMLTIFDQWNDEIIDGIALPVSVNCPPSVAGAGLCSSTTEAQGSANVAAAATTLTLLGAAPGAAYLASGVQISDNAGVIPAGTTITGSATNAVTGAVTANTTAGSASITFVGAAPAADIYGAAVTDAGGAIPAGATVLSTKTTNNQTCTGFGANRKCVVTSTTTTLTLSLPATVTIANDTINFNANIVTLTISAATTAAAANDVLTLITTANQSGTNTGGIGANGANITINLGEVATHQWQSNIYTKTFIDTTGTGLWQDASGAPTKPGIPLVPTNIRFRDGSISNVNSTNINGIASFNEVFPLFNWYVVETDDSRYKNTGVHIVYDAGGPADGSTPGGTKCDQNTANGANPCANSTIANGLANTWEKTPLPQDLWIPGAVYCALADCYGKSVAAGILGTAGTTGSDPAPAFTYNSQTANVAAIGQTYTNYGGGINYSSGDGMSTGRIDPPTWWGTYGWQGYSGQGNFIEWGKKPYVPGETGGIRGHVVYASTRPFDNPALLVQNQWEPLVPHVTINLYQVTLAADGVTQLLTKIDSTTTTSWDDWAQGYRTNQAGQMIASTSSEGGYVPNMSCAGQTTSDLYFYGIANQPQWLDYYDNVLHPAPGTTAAASTIPMAYNSQFKCYDGMHPWNQLVPAPYDGMYTFPSVTGFDPVTGRPSGTNCTACVQNIDSSDPYRYSGNTTPNTPYVNPTWNCTANGPCTQATDASGNLVGSAGTPVLPAGNYVVEVVVPPGYQLVKEEDKNILIGDNFIAPATVQFPGLSTNVFILPDQAAIGATQNTANAQNPTVSLGRNALPNSEADTGMQEQFWPCVGTLRQVPDFISLFPQSQEVAPFAGAKRNLCDRKAVTLNDQSSALAKFYIWTPTHIAGHFTGIILDDFTSEFDPYSPGFGEKFAPAYLPVSVKDWAGNEISRVYADGFGLYNGLSYSTWEVNPPNPTGYAPTMMVMCMNDSGYGTPNPWWDTSATGPLQTSSKRDPMWQYGYSQFCYELPFMPGRTGYFDTPVTPDAAFVDGYNHPDCSYPNLTPAISSVTGDVAGPWVAAPGSSITINALGDEQVENYGYSGPSISKAPYNAQQITRHYGFGGTAGTVSIGGVNAPVTAWSDTAITATVPATIAACPVQQQVQYGQPTSTTVTSSPAESVSLSLSSSTKITTIFAKGATTLTFVGTSADATVGAAVSGAGIAAGTTVTKVTSRNTPFGTSYTVTLSKATSAASSGLLGETVTFTVSTGGSKTVSFTASAVPAGLTVGAAVSDTLGAFASGTTVTAISTTGTGATATVNVTLSNANTAAGTDSITFTTTTTTVATTACGQLQITTANGQTSVDTVTVTVGGKKPTVMAAGQTIQNAIDLASPGDMIIVPPGVYNEMVLMYKPVRLQGVGAASSIIDSNAQPSGKLLNPWRQRMTCLFGLTTTGVPRTGNDMGCTTGWNYASGYASSTGDATGDVAFPTIMVDRLPFESITQWNASMNGNLAEQSIEPSLMGAEEGAGITVLGKGIRFVNAAANPTQLVDAFGNAPGDVATNVGAAYPINAVLLNADDCQVNTTQMVGINTANVATSFTFGPAVVGGSDTTNRYPGNFYCNPSAIDGLGVRDSSQGGGGINVHAYAHHLQIANNRVYNNLGTLSGGITIGQGEHPDLNLGGTTAVITNPPSCELGNQNINNAPMPFCFDNEINVHNNAVYENVSLGAELFSSTPAGAGGISVNTGSDYYNISSNWVCGNLSSGDGGGVSHIGWIKDGTIANNQILFNKTQNPTIVTNGAGLLVMGAPDVDPTGCGVNNDQDCQPLASTVTPSDGSGFGTVVNANLILGNSADSGSGGGMRLQNINGNDVVNWPNQTVATANHVASYTSMWNSVAVTNNIIVNNEAGWDGGGMSLQDALYVNIVNNTVAHNDSTASAGPLFGSVFAPMSSAPSTQIGCYANITQASASAGLTSVASCAQVAGVVSVANSAILQANTVKYNGTNATTALQCPSAYGGYNCYAYSDPVLFNDLIWQNRSFVISTTGMGPGTMNQQQIVTLMNADASFPKASVASTPTPIVSQTTTGMCPSSGSAYWDLGVRGDAGPHTPQLGGVQFYPYNSAMDDTTLYANTTTASYNNVGGSTFVPGFQAAYCNGGRTPPEAGGQGWFVPPGTNETGGSVNGSTSQATGTNPMFFSLVATATVDEGDNWINMRWGPLSLTLPANDSASSNFTAPVYLGNYAIGAGSSAVGAGAATVLGVAAPATDFYGNKRPSANGYDIGAVEYIPPPAIIALSATTASVANTQTGQTNTTSITVSNNGVTGAANLVVSGITSTNSFVTANGCASPGAAAGSTCTITITFAPTKGGFATTGTAETATLTIASNASNAAPTVTVSATAFPALATLSPSPVNFGTVADGSTTSQATVTVTNTGYGPLYPSFSVPNASAYTVAAGTCAAGTAVPMGGTCTELVYVDPARGTVGGDNSTLTLTAGAYLGSNNVALEQNQAFTDALDATAFTAAASITPSGANQSYAFGNQVLNSTTTSTAWTLKNTNSAAGDSWMPSLSFTGTNTSQYTVSGCSTALAPGASCTLTVTFKPTSTGPKNGASLVVSAGSTAVTTISLTGTGAPLSLVSAGFTGNATSGSDTITVTNVDNVTLTLGAPTLGTPGGGNTTFALATTGTCKSGKTLTAGSSCTVIVNSTNNHGTQSSSTVTVNQPVSSPNGLAAGSVSISNN